MIAHMPRRIKLTLEYDGTDFYGWQVQDRAAPDAATEAAPAVRTVQGEVERALQRLTGKFVRIAGAGRTDEGVHARGQVATFDLPDEVAMPDEQLVTGLNAHMPVDVSAVQALTMGPDFHAMASAKGKLYRYRIFNRAGRGALYQRFHWHVRFKLDAERMAAAARAFVGTHDYTAFATTLADIQARRVEDGKNELPTVREIFKVDVAAQGSYDAPGGAEIIVDVEGSGFLYKMVRTMVGSLVEVGRGRYEPGWIAQVLASRDRRQAGPTAPAKGLSLERVDF